MIVTHEDLQIKVTQSDKAFVSKFLAKSNLFSYDSGKRELRNSDVGSNPCNNSELFR